MGAAPLGGKTGRQADVCLKAVEARALPSDRVN